MQFRFTPHVMVSNPPEYGGKLTLNARFGSGLQEAGHKGVATGRRELSLCSPYSTGIERPVECSFALPRM